LFKKPPLPSLAAGLCPRGDTEVVNVDLSALVVHLVAAGCLDLGLQNVAGGLVGRRGGIASVAEAEDGDRYCSTDAHKDA
jgi:hypothetical protein